MRVQSYSLYVFEYIKWYWISNHAKNNNKVLIAWNPSKTKRIFKMHSYLISNERFASASTRNGSLSVSCIYRKSGREIRGITFVIPGFTSILILPENGSEGRSRRYISSDFLAPWVDSLAPRLTAWQHRALGARQEVCSGHWVYNFISWMQSFS